MATLVTASIFLSYTYAAERLLTAIRSRSAMARFQLGAALCMLTAAILIAVR